MLAVLLYIVVTAGLNLWRDYRVDTWSGPDASVSSGQRLPDCPIVLDFRDPIFPAWVRFEGSIYRGTQAIRPIGSNRDNAYPDTGYRLGPLRLMRAANTPEGRAGEMIVLKLDTSLTGQVYIRTPECP
ncbi:MAG: hypothetical protein C0498_01785 [Anaerolinea sp.]|jgi:hypothetical protein|nr:hypothetical protein [Anaerolinea sp.]